MAKKLHFITLLLSMIWTSQVQSQVDSATYTSGGIPLNYLTYSSTCSGTLSVTLPTGNWEVLGVDVSYDITADLGAYLSEQNSQIACVNTGLDEGQYYQGVGFGPGTQSYVRNNLTIANGFYTGGNIDFVMKAYRSWGSLPTCDTTYQKVNNNSWKVKVYYQAVSPCSGTPTAGIVNSTLPTVCDGESFTLNLNGATSAPGITYQWQTSSDSINWSNVSANGTMPTYTGIQSSDTFYRCILTCSGQSDTTAGFKLEMSHFTDCYCTPVSTSGCGYYAQIDQVSIPFTTLNNTSGCGGGYSQYTPGSGTTASLLKGNTYMLNITGSGTFSNNYYVEAWLDYNQNGAFEASEALSVNNGAIVNGVPTSTSFTVPISTPTGVTGLRVRSSYYAFGTAGSCGSVTYGEAEDYLVTIVNPPSNDVGIQSIDTPMVASCTIANSLWVTLENKGTSFLTQATLGWSVNGALQTPVNWTGSISSFNNSSSPVFISNYTFSAGDSIAVWAYNPNGTIDSLAFNDTLTMIVPNTALNGVYTIDPNGVGANNYPDFASVISDLSLQGICGPVEFNIADGVFNEQIKLGVIPGISIINTVTFNSQSSDTAACIIEYSALNAYDGPVVFETGAAHITFNNIGFKNAATTSTYGNVVAFNGATNNISFNGCRLQNNFMTTTSSNANIVHKNGFFAQNITFTETDFVNGANGIYFLGNTGMLDTNLVIQNCNFINQYYRGIYATAQFNPQIISNEIRSQSSYTYGYGMQLTTFEGVNLKVNFNKVYQLDNNPWPRYGFYLSTWESEVLDMGELIGNYSSLKNGGSAAFYMYNMRFLNFKNNSAYLVDASASNEAVYISQGSVIDMKNNAFASGSSARPLYVTGNGVATSNYNAFTGESSYVYWNGAAADLTALQSQTNKDQNSHEPSVLFLDSTYLRVCDPALDGAGEANAVYTTDWQGDPVDPSFVDIGADQFATQNSFSRLFPDSIGICQPGDTVTVIAHYFDSISWNLGFATGDTFNTTSQGVLLVDGYGICGTGSDTIIITNAIPVNLPTNAGVCANDTGYINAGLSGGSYMWSTGDTTQVIEITSTGNYAVTVTDKDGCVSSDQTIAIEANAVSLPDTVALCDGNDAQIDAGINNADYSWSTGDVSQTITVSNPGNYAVTVLDEYMCLSADTAVAVAQQTPNADFSFVTNFLTVQFSNTGTSGSSYIWDFGDGDTSRVENPTKTYFNDGSAEKTYEVTLIVINPCGIDSISYEIKVGLNVGSETVQNLEELQLYPNPTSDQLNLELKLNEAVEVTYQVLDLKGQVITEVNLGVQLNVLEKVSLSELAKGVYLMHVTAGEQTTVERIVLTD